jgi:thiol-disulfide isomerase/thioredoxin
MIRRLGLAIVQPRFALATAADRRYTGRSGSDLIALIVLALIATQLRGLVAAVWIGAVIDIGDLGRGIVQVLAQTLSIDLAFLVASAFALWLLAGKRREIGRAFDLACVVVLPLLFVQVGATVVVRTLDVFAPVTVPGIVGVALSIASYAWTGILFAYAYAQRPTTKPLPDLPDEIVRPARRAGLAIVAVVAVGIVSQAVWIAQHPELVRPMTSGDPAPGLSLPTITPAGELGPRMSRPEHTIVIVDFWATWCKPCLAAMPELDALARRHPNITVIAVNVDDAAKARALFDAQHYSMTLVFDDNDTADRFGVHEYPYTVLIGRDGGVLKVTRGHDTAIATLVDQLDR